VKAGYYVGINHGRAICGLMQCPQSVAARADFMNQYYGSEPLRSADSATSKVVANQCTQRPHFFSHAATSFYVRQVHDSVGGSAIVRDKAEESIC